MTTISYFHKDFMRRFQHVTMFASGDDGHFNVNGDEDNFEIVHINDFASEQIKSEIQKYEDSNELTVTLVCPAYHGGPLDYPKVSAASSANITDKWDYCYEKLEVVMRSRQQKQQLQRTNSDEEVYEQLTGDSLRKTEAFVFIKEEPEVDETLVNEDEFFSAVSESASKMIIHNTKLAKDLLCKGDMKSMFPIIGGLALVRNKLWHYNEHVEVQGQSKPFREQYSEVCQLFEALADQVLEYHCALVASVAVHDPASNDWSNERPFYEGEKASHSVQMWWYFLQGLRHDLWVTLPPKTAQRLLKGVFVHSLGIVAARYLGGGVAPSMSRIAQYRGDVTAILLISVEVLAAISGSLDCLTLEDNEVHIRCNHLLAALALISSPMDELTTAVAKAKKIKNRNGGSKVSWMKLMRPDLFSGDELPNLSMLITVTSSQPEPSWPLMVQTMLCEDMAVAKLILMHFGGHASKEPEEEERLMTDGCEGYECKRECVAAADSSWPQSVGTAVMQVCMEGTRDKKVLCNLVDPLLKKLSSDSWATLDKSNRGRNCRKPVCFEAVSQLLEPFLLPVLHELFSLMEAGKAWRTSQVAPTLKEVLSCVHDIIPSIPIQILHMTKHLDAKLPSAVKPLCKSTLTQLLMASLHSTLSRLQPILRKRKLAKEKVDFLVTFCEALSALETSVELLTMQNVADEALADDEYLATAASTEQREYSFVAAEVAANEMLADPGGGAFALKVLYRFVCYNSNWILSELLKKSSSSSSLPPVLIRPWGKEVFPLPSPYIMMNQIGGLQLQEVEDNRIVDGCVNGNGVTSVAAAGVAKGQALAPCYRFDNVMQLEHPWSSYLDQVLKYGNPLLTSKLMSFRPEMREDERDRARVKVAIDAWNQIYKIGGH